MGALFIRGEPLSSTNLSHDDVIVISYSYIRAELRPRSTTSTSNWPTCPELGRAMHQRGHTSRSSAESFETAHNHRGGWLVLDDAHALMNTRGETYSAIHEVWGLFNSCLVDVGWPDRSVLDEEPPAAASLAGTPSDIARPYGSGVTSNQCAMCHCPDPLRPLG